MRQLSVSPALGSSNQRRLNQSPHAHNKVFCMVGRGVENFLVRRYTTLVQIFCLTPTPSLLEIAYAVAVYRCGTFLVTVHF